MEIVEDIKKLKLPEIEFKCGERIFHEGVVHKKMFILLSGSVRILVRGEKLVDVTEAGSVIGETSFLLGCEATADVDVLEDARFLEVKDASKLMAEHAELWFRLSQMLAHRCQRMNGVFLEVKHELEKHTGKTHSKLYEKFYRFMIATNEFFDRDVKHPFTETEEAQRHNEELVESDRE